MQKKRRRSKNFIRLTLLDAYLSFFFNFYSLSSRRRHSFSLFSPLALSLALSTQFNFSNSLAKPEKKQKTLQKNLKRIYLSTIRNEFFLCFSRQHWRSILESLSVWCEWMNWRKIGILWRAGSNFSIFCCCDRAESRNSDVDREHTQSCCLWQWWLLIYWCFHDVLRWYWKWSDARRFFSKFLSINIFYKIHHKENHPDLVPTPPLTFLITSHHHFSSVLIYRWWAWLAWFRRTLHDAKCSSIGSISRGKRKCWGRREWGFSQFQSCSRRDAPKICFCVRNFYFLQ